jgi:hypothetical protein
VAATAAASLWVGLRRAPSGASGPEPDPSPAGPGAQGADANGDVYTKEAFDGAVLKADGTAWSWGVSHNHGKEPKVVTIGGDISVASGLAMMPSLAALTAQPVMGFSGLQGTTTLPPLPHYVTHAGSGWSGQSYGGPPSGISGISGLSGTSGYTPLGMSGFAPKASGAMYGTSGYSSQSQAGSHYCHKCKQYIGTGVNYCYHCGAHQKPTAMSWGNACNHKVMVPKPVVGDGFTEEWSYARKDGGCWFCSRCGKRAPEDWVPPEPPKEPTLEELNPEAGDGSRWDEI